MTSVTLARTKEGIIKWALFLCALFAIFAIIVITVYLFANGLPFIFQTGIDKFLFSSVWNLNAGSYGIAAMLVTTLVLTAMATLGGGVLGLLTAICIYKFLPRFLKKPVGFCINLLSGIPSVIYGLFGLSVVVPFIADYLSPNASGYGILSASIVLMIMVLPTMVSMSLDALNATDPMYYEGALALGSTKEEAVFKIMVPAAKSGIFAALVLSCGRALGETMAVILVLGGSVNYPTGLTVSVRTLTANIAMGAMELTGDDLTALVACGVVLFVLTLLINGVFALFRSKMKHV